MTENQNKSMTIFWIVPKANADVIDVQVWLINRHILSFNYKPGSLKKRIIKGIARLLFQSLSFVSLHIFRYYIAPYFMIGEPTFV